LSEGWLLDIYPEGDDIVLWIKTRGGKAESYRIRYPPRLYVHASEGRMKLLESQLDDEEALIRAEYLEKRVDIRDYEPKTVMRLEIRSKAFRGIVERLWPFEGRGYRFFNVDIPRAQEFLYEYDLFPLSLLSIRSPRIDGIELLDDRFSLEYEAPPLRCLSVEVYPRDENYAPIERIVLEMDGDRAVLEGGREDERMMGLVELVDEMDPDVVFVTGGEMAHLARRARENGVLELISLSRDRSRTISEGGRGRSYFSYGRIYYKHPHQPLFGRIHIDPVNSFIYTDCGMAGLVEFSRLTKIPLEKSSTSSPGTGISSMQLDQAFRENLLIPWRKQEPEFFKSAMHLLECDRGGFVFEPSIGFHTHIGEIDFSSMYPSIMERHNISPETVLCDCCRGGDAPRVPTCGYHICTKRRGIVPKVIKPLLERRAIYKRYVKDMEGGRADEYDARQRTIKWLLVTCFGYLGYKNARFGRVEAHEAVTAFGREKLFKAAEIAEANGYEVLHGIVDSLWLRREDADESDYRWLCTQIENSCGIPVSLEGIYRWVVFLPSKMDPRVPVLNRYFGVFEDGEIKARGIELRRTDTPGIVRKAQLEMLIALSEARNLEEYMKGLWDVAEITREYADRIRRREVDLEDLVISRRVSKEPWEYTNMGHIAVSSLKLHRMGRTIHPGEFTGYVIIDASSPDPWARVEPIESYRDWMEYDEKKYIDLLVRAGATLFEALGVTVDQFRDLALEGRVQSRLARPSEPWR